VRRRRKDKVECAGCFAPVRRKGMRRRDERPACRSCRRLSEHKWSSARAEVRRILAAEAAEAAEGP